MTREETVRVRGIDGAAVAFCAGKYGLKIEAGETAEKWLDGSPITRGEFENVLKRRGPFEIVKNVEAKSPARGASPINDAEPKSPVARSGRLTGAGASSEKVEV